MIPLGVLASAHVSHNGSIRVHAIRVPAGTVTADLDNFVTRVDLSNMPASWWNQGVTAAGIRVKSLPSGTALPVDVVWIDPDTTSGDLYFRADLASASDNDFWVDFDASLDPLAESDPLGRNAVWADYEAVLIRDAVNRTGAGTVSTVGAEVSGSDLSVRPIGPSISYAHQGIALDDTHVYVFDTTILTKRLRSDMSSVATIGNTITAAGLATPYNHTSDGCLVDGVLYTCIAEYPRTDSSREQIALFDAEDLSFVAKYDISATGHQVSSICSDGTYLYTVGYNVGTNYDTSIQKWSLTCQHISTITLSASVPNMQGVAIHGGRFWISQGGTTAPYINLYSCEMDGSDLQEEMSNGEWGRTNEGLAADADGLYLLHVNTLTDIGTVWQILPKGSDLVFSEPGALKVGGLSALSSWSMGVTALLTGAFGRNHAAIGYDKSATSSTREAIVADWNALPGGNRWGVWNATDGWDHASTQVAVGDQLARVCVSHDGTSSRKLYIDGALDVTNSTVAVRPSAGDTFLVGCGSAAASDWSAESFIGVITRAYLREGVLSAAWVAAEAVSWESPAQFYTIVT